jgi:hypothetical protein
VVTSLVERFCTLNQTFRVLDLVQKLRELPNFASLTHGYLLSVRTISVVTMTVLQSDLFQIDGVFVQQTKADQKGNHVTIQMVGV